MAQTSGFFNANIVEGVPDRAYSAIDFAKYFAAFVGNGVFAHNLNELQVVTSDNNLFVKVKSGRAFCNGYWYQLDEDIELSINSNTGTTPRYDAIVVSFNFSTRTAELEVKTGITENSYKNAKQYLYQNLSRDTETVFQLCLAIIKIPAYAYTYQFSEADIYDVRAEEYCGWVTGLVDQLDTSSIVTQLQASFDAWFASSTAQFNAWFEAIVGQLTEDAAGNLQNQISVINQQILQLTPVTLYEHDWEHFDFDNDYRYDGYRIYFTQNPLDFDEIVIYYMPNSIAFYADPSPRALTHNAIACQTIAIKMPNSADILLSQNKKIHVHYIYTSIQDENDAYYYQGYQHRIYELYGEFKQSEDNSIYIELNSCRDLRLTHLDDGELYPTVEGSGDGTKYHSQIRVLKIVGHGNRRSSAPSAATTPYNEIQSDRFFDNVREVTE